MPTFCTAPSLQGPVAEDLVDFVDCQAKALGEIGYRTLAAPDSSVGLMLVGLLTIFIALIGFRLLLGETPTLRRVVLDAVRVGIVLTLATSWAAYHVLVYDIATQTPIALAAEISQPTGLPGPDGSLLVRLQDVADQLARFGGTPGATVTFLVSTLGALLATRAVTGLLLALGPLVATFLLFDATRGLFEGWIRALLAMVLGTFTTLVLLGFELSVLEPVLEELTRARQSGTLIAYGTEWPSAIAALFAFVIVAGLIAALKIASGFRFVARRDICFERAMQGTMTSRVAMSSLSVSRSNPAEDRVRALAVSDALAASVRRETIFGGSTASAMGRGETAIIDSRRQAVGAVALGQSRRRLNSPRVSAANRRRDRS